MKFDRDLLSRGIHLSVQFDRIGAWAAPGQNKTIFLQCIKCTITSVLNSGYLLISVIATQWVADSLVCEKNQEVSDLGGTAFLVSCAQPTLQTSGTDYYGWKKYTPKVCHWGNLNPPYIRNRKWGTPNPRKTLGSRSSFHPSYPTYKNSRNSTIRLSIKKKSEQTGDISPANLISFFQQRF